MTALYLYAPIKEVSTWGISLFALATGLLILCFQHPSETQAHSLFTKVMVWLGQRSYETYLFHLVVLGLMKVAFIPAQTDSSIKIMLLIGYLVLTFIISAAIEKYYSTPLNSYIRKVLLKINHKNKPLENRGFLSSDQHRFIILLKRIRPALPNLRT